MHALDPVHLANAVTGVAFLALGVWVLWVRADDRANLAFGTYAIAWALTVFTSNLGVEVSHDTQGVLLLNLSMGALVGLGLCALVALHPHELSRRDLVPALLALGLGVATLLWAEPVRGDDRVYIGDGQPLFLALNAVFAMGFWIALFFLAFRWRALDDGARRAVALMSAAVAPWPTYASGAAAALASTPLDLLGDLALPVGLAGVWLWNAHHEGGKVARAVAWLTLATALAAMLERAAFPAAPDLWGFGLVRLLGVAILAYAIVRHQLLHVDVRVRWTLSQGTVAAAFVAVFFVASEMAQALLGETLRSTYVGIAATGALVFALAPLQRAAERLAEKAVPMAPAPAVADDRRAQLYRRSLRFAMRDGRISPEEELHLFEVAQELGLGAGDAMRLRQEVERDLAQRS